MEDFEEGGSKNAEQQELKFGKSRKKGGAE
jgi:hypothetical protein